MPPTPEILHTHSLTHPLTHPLTHSNTLYLSLTLTRSPLCSTLNPAPWYPQNNYFTYMCSGSETGSCLRLIDFCITQLFLHDCPATTTPRHGTGVVGSNGRSRPSLIPAPAQGATSMAHMLRSNSTLLLLDLRMNNIRGPGVCVLADALAENTTLTDLDMRWNYTGECSDFVEFALLDLKKFCFRNILQALKKLRVREDAANKLVAEVHPIHPTPYTLHSTPYTLHPTS